MTRMSGMVEGRLGWGVDYHWLGSLPSQRLRRIICLERAAYRLTTLMVRSSNILCVQLYMPLHPYRAILYHA